MFAIGYHGRPPLPGSSNGNRQPVTKKILSISWKIDHFQARTGIVESVLFSTSSLSDNQPSEIWCLELDTCRPSMGPPIQPAHSPDDVRHHSTRMPHSLSRGSSTSSIGSQMETGTNPAEFGPLAASTSEASSNYMSLYLRLVYFKQEFGSVHLKAGVFTERMDVTVLGEKDFQTDEPIGWAQFLNKESVSKFILGQDKQDDGGGYIHLYLELILNETKRKVGVECKAFAHSDLIMDFSHLLQSRALSDVTLICGDRHLFAHKALLAARSPVFKAMFMHCNSQENQTSQIELKDVEFEILEELINFIYTGQVTRLDSLADSLLPVADKYDIVSLVKLCEESLSFNLSVENVVHRLVLSYLHNAVTLKRAALGYIERNICTVRLTDGWREAQMKYPQLFLNSFPYTEQLSLIVSKSMMSF